MSLKRSDKIIAVVGVIIILVAIAGILFYYETEDTTEGNGTPTEKVEYKVEWIEETGNFTIDGAKAGKNAPYTDPININLKDGEILKDVDIYISWSDDYSSKFSLPNRNCADTLTATFTPIEGEAQTHESVGSGEDNLHFVIYKDIDPEDGTIDDVSDIYEAESRILENYSDKNSASFDVEVKVKTGESKILIHFRAIKKIYALLDKGNGFDLTVSYNYLRPDVQEVKIEGSEPPVGTSMNQQTGVHTSQNIPLSRT